MQSHGNSSDIAVLLAVATHTPIDQFLRKRQSADIDWAGAIAKSSEHGVLPMLVQWVGNSQHVPGDLFRAARQHVTQNQMRNMQLFGELARIEARLKAAGIRMLPYKGPTLAIDAYGDLARRQAGDLDILVHPTDAVAAVKILREDGYVGEDGVADVDETSATEYHAEFTHPARRIAVELHWQIVGDSFSLQPAFDELWDRSRELNFCGRTLRIMSAEDSLLVLAVHGMKHFWSRLGWICDIAELVRSHPDIDWCAAIDRATALGGKQIVLLAIELARSVADIHVPLVASGRVSDRIRARAAQAERSLFHPVEATDGVTRGMKMELAGAGYFGTLLFHLRMRENRLDGVRYIWHRLFTPSAIEREWIALPTPLSPLYALVRPIRLFVRRFDGVRASRPCS